MDVERKKFGRNCLNSKGDINYAAFSSLPPWGSPTPKFGVTQLHEIKAIGDVSLPVKFGVFDANVDRMGAF